MLSLSLLFLTILIARATLFSKTKEFTYLFRYESCLLIKILEEFLRVLKPGGVAKLYPLPEWRLMRFQSLRLNQLLNRFSIEQRFVHGGVDFRVTPAMLTEMKKTDD